MFENKIKEKEDFQQLIIQHLKEDNGYVFRNSKLYNQQLAMDTDLLFEFLNKTQKEKLDKLATKSSYKKGLKAQVIENINRYIYDYCLIDALQNGVKMDGVTLDLMYSKPANNNNPNLIKKYQSNIFSVMEEVWHKEDERIDLVIFLNGIAIIAIELKCNTSGQNIFDAIKQYKTQRDFKTRLFEFKKGVLVCFGMDLNEVVMTTKLQGLDTDFLPFNKGNNGGKGNPQSANGIKVSYMWEDILKKDLLLYLIKKFIFVDIVEKENKRTKKVTKKEHLIFPRYHQLDCIRKLLADIKINKTEKNYLIEHSAGSGKTKTISWLTHILKSLHDDNDKNIFDSIIIVTDRKVVDKQLQKAVLCLSTTDGEVKVLDATCNSQDLQTALKNNTKIIVTTIHKFSYIALGKQSNKKFAVIIDEAHSSTEGSYMEHLTYSLGNDEEEIKDIEEIISKDIKSSGKQKNISMIAFTATPKATTLEIFGTDGKAFNLYSMKQAIEEGFILDVLKNYVTYRTYCNIVKKVQDDPELNSKVAKQKILKAIDVSDENIEQKTKIIVEHFREKIQCMLNGQAKAMVVTSLREAAVKYKLAFDKYLKEKNISDIKTLVAFTGKKEVNGIEYSEPTMNEPISSDELEDAFDTEEYQIMLVADKFQTGFDQPKLVAMYVDKKLEGINAVQTLSRLNRAYKGKETFILDFKNEYIDIIEAFKPYYESTELTNKLNPNDIYKIEKDLDSYYFLDKDDIDNFISFAYKNNLTVKEKERMVGYLTKALDKIKEKGVDIEKEIILKISSFIHLYGFIIKVSDFEDVNLHKKYVFFRYLINELSNRQSSTSITIQDKITITNFIQKKTGEIKTSNITGYPDVSLPSATPKPPTPVVEEKLSKIIDDIMKRYGLDDKDKPFYFKSVMQIKDIMLTKEDLKYSAKANSIEDFKLKIKDSFDDALTEGIEKQDIILSKIAQDKDIQDKIINTIIDEVYTKLKNK